MIKKQIDTENKGKKKRHEKRKEKRREEKNLTKKQGKYNVPCLFETNLRKKEEGTNAPF